MLQHLLFNFVSSIQLNLIKCFAFHSNFSHCTMKDLSFSEDHPLNLEAVKFKD